MFALSSRRMSSLLALAVPNSCSENHKRGKRYLIFTPSTQWGVFATVSVPLHPEATVSVAWFFEANYYIVDNTTYYQPLLGDIAVNGRQSRSAIHSPGMFTRAYVYTFAEAMLEKHGFSGKECLLRAICENSHISTLHSGIIGDLLHFVLTPSTSLSEESVEDTYYEAEYYGLERQCHQYEHDCPSNPLDFISVFIENIK
ncbi:unnamed protein product [Chilo suppressalis]|uniref:Uncharacterized protein n=1 Tax=Chilo suppressalis TaxID=168631 RepID=A0ABN8ATU5_CHISP|nr:unnamed protein product [Chilo suppressalis]